MVNTDHPSPLVVLSGLSGAGKSIALRTLEDLGYYCVDNLPAELLPQLVASLVAGGPQYSRVAVGIDVRNRPDDLGHLPHSLAAVGAQGIEYQLVFIDASDQVLLKRFSETRRRHPLSRDGLPLGEAIARERELLQPLRSIADIQLDSSELNVHQLRRLIITELGLRLDSGLSLLIESFAFRRGLPPDADFVFDARCLPNPHWDARLRPLSGRDAPVREFLDAQPLVQQFFGQIASFLDAWLPRFEADTRSYLTVAIGCTGGRHRSVYLAETLAAHLRAQGRGTVLTYHRELE